MKKMKALSLTLVTALSVSMLSACGLAKQSSSPAPAADNGSKDAAKDGGQKAATVTLKLSHQWPKATADSGDFRGQLAERFAAEVAKRTNGSVKVDIYPASSLVKSTDQWDAIQQGAIDLSVFPLDYATGKVPLFDVTLMPALVKSHEQARQWQSAEIGKKIEDIADQNGVKILTWVWNAGGIGSKGDPIVQPSDIKKGMKMRAAGKRVEEMLKNAGAGITSMASSEIYSSFQTGVLDAAITSASSFGSYKLYEQVKSYVSPTKNTFWFMLEPLIIGKNALAKLTPDQQKAVIEAGQAVQQFAYDASQADDSTIEKKFKDAGVNVVQMDDAAFDQWHQMAQKVWEDYGTNVKGGQEIIDLAKQVK